MSLEQIFIDLKLHDIVTIFPWQLNNELYLHLKKNLKEKVEKKCIDIGYICKVLDIVEYKNGYLLPEDLTGNVNFKITYNAKVCIPIPNNLIICKVDQIFKSVIMAQNGPVVALIKFTDISINFTLNNLGGVVYKRNNKVLEPGDYIKVSIRSKRSFNGDTHIGVMGFIEDMVVQEEINKYMYREFEDDNDEINVSSNKYTHLNEDETIDEGVVPTNIPDKNMSYIQEI